MAITKVINDAVDLNQTSDYSGLRLPVGTTGNVVESFTTDYLVVAGGGAGGGLYRGGGGGAGGLRTSYNNSTTTTNSLSFPSGKTAIATYMLDNNATDVSGNYNGAETNITYNTGQYGGGAVFNGSSSKIILDNTAFKLTTYTISHWIYSNDYSQSGVGTYDGGLDQTGGNWKGFSIIVNNNKISSYGGNNGSFYTGPNSTTTLVNGTWYHVAFVIDGTSIKGYINGVHDTALNYTLNAAMQYSSTSTNVFHLGVRSGNFGSFGYFNGSIDQARIYNSALSSNDVNNIYDNEVQANSGGGAAAESSLTLSAGTAYNVTIGAGGIGVFNNAGGDGGNSVFNTIDSEGGGGGSQYSANAGRSGGSGGGSAGYSSTTGSGGNGTIDQGYAGGQGNAGGPQCGGGGGGASATGEPGGSGATDGDGGDGVIINILNSTNAASASVGEVLGSNVYYSGGAGGGNYGTGNITIAGKGGGAVGASGSSPYTSGPAATNNTGGGGGGGNGEIAPAGYGGNGGSGVVILRYPTASVSSFTTTGTLNTPSTTNTIADTAYPVANIAYYKLDNSAIDLSGSTGKFDQGGVFNGSSSFIQTSLSLNAASNSVSFWFNADSVGSQNPALYFNNRGGRIDITINSTSSNTATASNENILINSTTAITGWNFVSIVFTGWASSYSAGSYGSAITANVYLNGGSAVSLSPTPYGQSDGLRIGRSGGGYYFDGTIDQVRLYNVALSSDDVIALYGETISTTGQLNFPSGQTAIATYELNGNANGILTTTDLSTVNYPAGAGCIALYEMNGTADDTSGVYNGTPSNIDYNFGAFGQAAGFNGSNSGIFLTTSGNSVLDYDNDFSVSMWFKATSLNANSAYNNLWTAGGTRIIPMQVSTSAGVLFSPYDGSNNVVSTGSGSISLNQWYNVVATRSKTSGLKIYLNGVLKDTDSFTGNASSLSQRDTIGQYWDGTRNSFAGHIDQVRIFNTALTQAQVTTLARGIGTSYSGADTNVLYAYNGTPTNVTYENGRFGQAANLTATNGSIEIPGLTPSQFSATNVSVSVWVNMTSLVASGKGIYLFNVGSGSFQIQVTSSGVNFYKYNGTNYGAIYSTPLNLNQWYHIAATASTTAGMKLYLNGAEVASNSFTGTIDLNYNDIGWGYYNDYADRRGFSGLIDQGRIYGAALTSDQVTELYNEHYQTQFTEGSDTAIVFTQGTGTVTFSGIDPAPPQGALRTNTSYSEDGSASVIEHYNGTDWKYFDAIKYCTTNTLNFPSGAGCIASYNLNNNVNDIGNTYNGVNSNVTFTASGKFGAAAVFNGSSSYISIPQGSLPVGASARTVSMWINTTQTTLAELYGYGIDGNNLYYAVNINAAAGKIGTAFYANDHNFTASVIDGAWHHIVSVYNGNTVEMYVDGQSVGNATAGAVNTSAAGSPKIGKYNYTGSIDQVRIFNDSLTSDEVTQLYNNEIACS